MRHFERPSEIFIGASTKTFQRVIDGDLLIRLPGALKIADQVLTQALQIRGGYLCSAGMQHEQICSHLLDANAGNSHGQLDELVEVVGNVSLGWIAEVLGDRVTDHVLVGGYNEGGSRNKEEKPNRF